MPRINPNRIVCGALAAAVIAATGCAAPGPVPDASRQGVVQKKQTELSEMERMGQRNDDRPLPK